LFEVDEAMNRIRDEVDPEANIIFGSTFSDSMEGKMRISVVATGIEADQLKLPVPQPETASVSAQMARKPFGGAPIPAVRKEPTVVAAPRERTAAEIVRQSGSSVAAETMRAATPRPTVAQPATPVIRVIDEAALAEERYQTALQQQAMAEAQAAQTEQAMRMAAAAHRAAPVEETSAGPLFVSPRAEVPQQRTLFSAQTPEMDDEAEGEESGGNGGRGLFNRLANVGKSFAGTTRANPRMTASAAVPERKPEVRETSPTASEEDEFYDIPAFLRRQAN
jgi:cell division protein FtsZ